MSALLAATAARLEGAYTVIEAPAAAMQLCQQRQQQPHSQPAVAATVEASSVIYIFLANCSYQYFLSSFNGIQYNGVSTNLKSLMTTFWKF